MCGIVGYVGPRPAQDLIYRGLSRLEYRGYDSAGIAALRAENKGGFSTRGSTGDCDFDKLHSSIMK